MKPRFLLHAIAFLAIAFTLHADDVEELRRMDRELSVATWTGDALWFSTYRNRRASKSHGRFAADENYPTQGQVHDYVAQACGW